MKHPADEYRDAEKMRKDLEQQHLDAQKDGYYKGSSGSGPVSSGVKALAKLLITLLIFGAIAVAGLLAYNNIEVVKQWIDGLG